MVGLAEVGVLKSIVTEACKAKAGWSVTRRSHKSFGGVAQRLLKLPVVEEAGIWCTRLGLSKGESISLVVPLGIMAEADLLPSDGASLLVVGLSTPGGGS